MQKNFVKNIPRRLHWVKLMIYLLAYGIFFHSEAIDTLEWTRIQRFPEIKNMLTFVQRR